MARTFGLSHIQIAVRDLERSVRFYSQMLGMEELRRHGSHAAMLRTPGSHEVFTINANPDGHSHAGQMAGVAHFGFRLSEPVDLAALMDEVTAAGGTVLEHGTRGNDETYVFAADPDGYEVELFWMP